LVFLLLVEQNLPFYLSVVEINQGVAEVVDVLKKE
jgi:hypothetical protein